MARTPGATAPVRTATPGRPALPAGPPSRQVRRAVTLLVITCLVPGSAQLAVGDRRLGKVLVRVWLGLLAAGLLLGLTLLVDRPLALAVLTSPGALVLIALVCFGAAVVVPLALGDAWRLGRTPSVPVAARRWIGALTAVLMVGSCLVLVGTGRRLWAGADLIDAVFGSGRASAASDGRFNVLLLGGDAGPDRVGTRPDSVTLASVDAETGRTVLFSLPRNLENVPFPAGSAAARLLPRGWSCGDSCLLNGVYTWGAEHRSAFPGVADAGAEAMKQAVSGVTGLHVNYYVLIDLRGFSSLIDALGGIRVTVTRPVPIGGGTSKVSGYLQPGTRTLDGYHALWFARSRHGANDYERMARQRCVMDAMVHQLDPATVLSRFQQIAAAGRQVVSTDVPAAELGTFLDLAAKARDRRISSVQFVPPLIEPARPDLAAVRSRVQGAIEDSRRDAPDRPAPVAPASEPAAPASGPASSGAAPSRSVPSAPASSAPPATEDISAICRPA